MRYELEQAAVRTTDEDVSHKALPFWDHWLFDDIC